MKQFKDYVDEIPETDEECVSILEDICLNPATCDSLVTIYRVNRMLGDLIHIAFHKTLITLLESQEVLLGIKSNR